MKKTIYHFSLATLIFCAVMQIILSIYTAITGINIQEHGWLLLVDTVVNFLYLVSGGLYMFFVLKTVEHYMDLPESRITIPHAKAEVSWTEVERDPEGEEVSRSHYSVEFCHTMNDEQLNGVIEMWHRYRRKYEINARSSQDCVDFINMYTSHWGALTEEDLLNRLKHK